MRKLIKRIVESLANKFGVITERIVEVKVVETKVEKEVRYLGEKVEGDVYVEGDLIIEGDLDVKGELTVYKKED